MKVFWYLGWMFSPQYMLCLLPCTTSTDFTVILHLSLVLCLFEDILRNRLVILCLLWSLCTSLCKVCSPPPRGLCLVGPVRNPFIDCVTDNVPSYSGFQALFFKYTLRLEQKFNLRFRRHNISRKQPDTCRRLIMKHTPFKLNRKKMKKKIFSHS